ncbi:hypothetical protein J4444_02480 [Candidatus Woesearchaeota archaeon]|nr:hypothetical protein [Candidatus Woesearchaeota archaeon]
MLSTISQHLRNKLKVFFLTDNLVFNNKIIPITQEHFQEIPSNIEESNLEEKNIAFIDGGQAEILSGGNLSLSFIRIFAQVMKGEKKLFSNKYEFYLLTTASYKQGDMWYEGKIFPVEGSDLLDENDLIIASTDLSIKSGNERAPISKVANMARRFAELKVASMITADYILLDGTLEPTYKNEEKYLSMLGSNVSSIAKSCSLFTTCGNSPIVLLQKLSPFQSNWSYFIEGNSHFVKLNPKAKHIFRFEGNKEMLPHLAKNSTDSLFLGYPYGLILTDKMARISNVEKNSLKMNLLLRDENKEIVEYLNAMNAHDILDNLG